MNLLNAEIGERPILVVGASGLVGGALLQGLLQQRMRCVGTHRQRRTGNTIHLDIANHGEAMRTVSRVTPSAIFFPAATTNVELCEAKPAETWKTNVEDVIKFAEKCDAVPFIYYSSEYVFDGSNGPYSESDQPNPISQYGRQKVAAEQYFLARPRALVIRTVHVFGPEIQKKNFIYGLVRTLREGRTFPVPRDQISTPTYSRQLAQASIELFRSRVTGLVHLVGRDRLSRYDFARRAASAFNLDERMVVPRYTSEMGQAAPRPLSAGLVSRRVNLGDLGFTEVSVAIDRAVREMF